MPLSIFRLLVLREGSQAFGMRRDRGVSSTVILIPNPMSHPNRPPGIVAIALFFVFGATMSGLAAVMLLFPGSVLESLWRLNPRAREGFAGMGWWAVLLMTVVCLACAAAALGLQRCKRWGYWTALAILGVNLAGDVTNAVFGHDWRTLIGLPIGGVMIVYLLLRRAAFNSGQQISPPASFKAPIPKKCQRWDFRSRLLATAQRAAGTQGSAANTRAVSREHDKSPCDRGPRVHRLCPMQEAARLWH